MHKQYLFIYYSYLLFLFFNFALTYCRELEHDAGVVSSLINRIRSLIIYATFFNILLIPIFP
jgi:hypothetical protein